jgi:predicted metal-dependent phosphoesterase TrpH
MADVGQTLRVEFHCHTVFSKDSLVTPEQLLAVCRKRGIDRVVVSDHNTIQGALAAKALDPERVIVGEEILTQQGELLAVYVREEIPKGLTAFEAVARLRAQGALISVSHPFDGARGWQLAELEKIAPLVDAIEVFNARCLLGKYNRLAAAFAQQHGLLGTVGSDAHTLAEYGRAVMLLPAFDNAESLKQALRNGQHEVRSSGLSVRLGSRFAVFKKSVTGL